MVIKIGSDPEFLIWDSANGRSISAHNFFPNVHDNPHAKIGCDGHEDTAELRPDAFSDPIEHCREIQGLVKEADRVVGRAMRSRRYEFLAGANPRGQDPIGGHIHFSGYSKRIPAYVRALDKYVAIPLYGIEDTLLASERRRRCFGVLGEVRTDCDHGGFEWRVLSSWLTSSQIAKSVLSLAWVVVNEVEQRDLDQRFNLFKIEGLSDEYEYQMVKQAHRQSGCDNTTLIHAIRAPVLEEIKRMALYPSFQSEIDWLLKRITDGEVFPTSSDMRGMWDVIASGDTSAFYRLMINYEDMSMREIARGYKLRKLKRPVYIYGINSSRVEDVAISVSDFDEGINMSGLTLSHQVYGEAAHQAIADIKIGINARLRESALGIEASRQLMDYITCCLSMWRSINYGARRRRTVEKLRELVTACRPRQVVARPVTLAEEEAAASGLESLFGYRR